jgi:hypothetical protein
MLSRMNTIRTEVEITTDGSLKLLSPLPAWLKPGRAQILVMVNDEPPKLMKPKRPVPVATPEMLEARKKALEAVRELNPYRDIADPVDWQKEIRKDRPLPFRD